MAKKNPDDKPKKATSSKPAGGGDDPLGGLEQSSKFSTKNVEKLTKAAKSAKKEFKEIYDAVKQTDKELKGLGEGTTDISHNFKTINNTAGKLSEMMEKMAMNVNTTKDLTEKQSAVEAALRDIAQERDGFLEKAQTGQQNLTKLTTTKAKLEGDLTKLKGTGGDLDKDAIKAIEGKLKSTNARIISEEDIAKASAKQAEQLTHQHDKGKELLEIIKKMKEEAIKMDASNQFFTNAASFLKNIPGFSAFAAPFEQAATAARETLKDGGSTLEAFTAGFMQLGTLAFTGILTALFAFDKSTTAMAKQLSMSKDEAREMQDHFTNIALDSDLAMANAQSMAEALTGLSKEMGVAAGFSDKQVMDQVALTKHMGMSAKEAANIQKLGMMNGKTAEETTKTAFKHVAALEMQTGVKLDAMKVVKEIASVEGQLGAQYGFNTEEIAKAVVQAQSLGLSLKETSDMARGLLNFEQSISAELEAELLTGKQLNLEEARLLALKGDSAAAAQIMLDQVGSAAEFGDMNVLQQESLAKAMNMTADQMANSLRDQEVMNDLGAANMADLVEKGKLGELTAGSRAEEMYQEQLQLETAQQFQAVLQEITAVIASNADGIMPTIKMFAELLSNATAIKGIMIAMGVIMGGKVLTSLGAVFSLMGKLRLRAIGAGIASIVKGAWQAVGGIPVVGPALAVAAIAGGAGYLYGKAQADDYTQGPASPEPGYGKRSLLEKGSVTLFNDEDSIIAGTNLFGKSDDMISSPDAGNSSAQPAETTINVTSVMDQWSMGSFANTGTLNRKAEVAFHA